jgi:hypothetical protein
MRFIQSLVLPVLVIAAAAGFYLGSTTEPPDFNINVTKAPGSGHHEFSATVEQFIALLGKGPYHADRVGPHDYSP